MNSPFHTLTIFTRLTKVDDSVILEQETQCAMQACKAWLSHAGVLSSDAVTCLSLTRTAWQLTSSGMPKFHIRWSFAGPVWTGSVNGTSYHDLRTMQPGLRTFFHPPH